MPAANLNRIDAQLFGDLVEMNFEGVTRLRRTVTAFWTTRRFVGESAQALKLVSRHVISHGLQRAGVERARHAVTTVRAAIEKRLKVHRGDRPVVLHARFDFHQDWMASAMAVEDFLARERDLHWPSGDHRELAYSNLVIERIALPTEAAAVRRGDYADVCGG